jgi:hypothetical protein
MRLEITLASLSDDTAGTADAAPRCRQTWLSEPDAPAGIGLASPPLSLADTGDRERRALA